MNKKIGSTKNSFLFSLIAGLFLFVSTGVLAGLTVPTDFNNAVQYIMTTIFTSDGTQSGTPVVEINSGSRAMTVHTTDQNGIWIVPGALRDRSVLKDDLAFDIIDEITDCPEGSGFVYAIDANGKGFCRKIGPGDMTDAFSGTYQARITGACGVDSFMVEVLVDGSVICSSPTSGYINSLITQETVIKLGSGFFQKDIYGSCPVGSVVRSINDDGSLECVSILAILSQGQMCAEGYGMQGFSGGNVVCKPTSPITTCGGGMVTIGFNGSGGMICGLPTMPVCQPGSFFVGGTGNVSNMGTGCQSFASLGSCPAGQWIQSFLPNGSPICAGYNTTCTSGWSIYALSGSMVQCVKIPIPTMITTATGSTSLNLSCPPGHALKGIDLQGNAICLLDQCNIGNIPICGLSQNQQGGAGVTQVQLGYIPPGLTIAITLDQKYEPDSMTFSVPPVWSTNLYQNAPQGGQYQIRKYFFTNTGTRTITLTGSVIGPSNTTSRSLAGECKQSSGYVASCGNGVVDMYEQCDPSTQYANRCNPTTCQFPVCGNGVVEPGETCEGSFQCSACQYYDDTPPPPPGTGGGGGTPTYSCCNSREDVTTCSTTYTDQGPQQNCTTQYNQCVYTTQTTPCTP